MNSSKPNYSIYYCSTEDNECPFRSECKRYVELQKDATLPHTSLRKKFLQDEELYAYCSLFIKRKEEDSE